jgi:Heavy metal binding domain
MEYSRFLTALLLSASLTAFATAQSQTHEHSKMDMKSDTLVVKDTTQVIAKDRYTCPMHPEVISDKPGKCPKCGMKLQKSIAQAINKHDHQDHEGKQQQCCPASK